MHPVLWVSIFASAGVALVTTLAVEYFAKPGLEARKERILDADREERQAFKDLTRCIVLLFRLRRYVGTVSEEYISNVTAELSERMANAHLVLRPSRLIEHEWCELLIELQDYEQFVKRGLPREDLLKILDPQYDRFRLFYRYFQLYKWDVERRRQLVREIKSLNVDHRKVRSRRKKERIPILLATLKISLTLARFISAQSVWVSSGTASCR